MSVIVDHKKTAAPYNGKLQSLTPVKNTAPSKGRREEQKTNNFESSSGSAVAAVVGNSAGLNGVEKMNMMAIQRVDSHVLGLLSTVPQVVLYQYETQSNTWERTSTEGTLFIYSRDIPPSHGFVLLNRLSSDNLQEMVVAGSEYRVQGVFVLFKKHSEASGIYGLCFNDTSICANTGQLLTSLSHKAVASGNGAANRVVALSSDMRSHSVPFLPHTHTQGVASRSGGERVNILELLENAGNSYLNQVLSDDTGSSGQESPPSEGITFTAHPLTTSQQPEESQPGNSDSSSTTHTKHQKRSAAKEKIVMKRSTPRTIPKLVNMNANTTAPLKSLTPSTSHVQSQMQYSSRVAGSAKQSLGFRLPHGAGETPTNHAPKQEVMYPLRSATAPGHVASSASTNRRKPTRQAGPAKHKPSAGPLEEVIPEQPLVRKLFSPENVRDSSGADSGGNGLQNLFSQSLPTPLETNNIGPIGARVSFAEVPPPIQPMSLAEIEKQMNEEVPSPDTMKPFSLTPSSSAHSFTPSSTSTLSTSAPDGESMQLLQPSAFSATPPTGTTCTSTPPGTRCTVAGDRSDTTSSSTVMLQSVLQRSCTAGSITVSVEPPSPVVSSQQTTNRGFINGVFPNVPPLMHSPGMRAPPVTPNTVQQLTQKQTAAVSAQKTEPKGQGGKSAGAGRRGGGKGGMASRGGSRSPGRSRSPEGSVNSPSPQPGIQQDVGDTPSRSLSVPNNMSPVSEAVLSQQVAQPHTLLSPRQFSSHTDTVSETPSMEVPVHLPLSREHFKHALIHLIQNDDDFVSRIHHVYQLSVAQQRQHQ